MEREHNFSGNVDVYLKTAADSISEMLCSSSFLEYLTMNRSPEKQQYQYLDNFIAKQNS